MVDNYSTQWEYRVYPINFFSNTWISTTTKSINLTQLQSNSYYVFEIKNICNNGGSFNTSTKRIFLTDGDYCNGGEFTDTGGASGLYSNNEYLVKTFYPPAGKTYTMTFSQFDLESGYDFMTIYDGDSTDDPIFTNANLISGSNVGGPFVSTHPSGAITVKFVSDAGTTQGGWNASFSCSNLSTTNYASNLFNIYPNPTSAKVQISAEENINEVNVYDTTGRLVKSLKSIESKEAQLDLSKLSSGVYFIKVSSLTSNGTKQIIKN